MRFFGGAIALVLAFGPLVGAVSIAFAGEPTAVESEPPTIDPVALDHFESRIRPLLAERCWKCHGEEKSEANLRLDGGEGVARGGDSGPPVAPGDPEASLLFDAVRYRGGLEMPPDGRLSETQIADLRQWIASGAPWPDDAGTEPPLATDAASAAALAIAPLRPDDAPLAPYLLAWYRADDLALADGESVHVWPDRSGGGRDLAATRGVRADGAGLPPRLALRSSVHRRPAVRFDPESGLAASPGNPLPLVGDAGYTIVLVVNLTQNDAQPPYDGVFGLGNPAYAGDPGRPLAALVQINRDATNHSLRLAGGWNHDASLGDASFLPRYGQPLILVVGKRPGALDATVTFSLNGELSAPAVAAPEIPDIAHRGDIGMYLGRAVSWAGSFRGDVAEILLYSKELANDERRGLEEHLADKYAILLPGHIEATRAQYTPEERAHWAYQPVADPTPPAVRDTAWPRTSIDRFVLARLEGAGLAPAAEADRRTLLRRVTLDLTGLPPTPEEMAAFEQDESPRAYERVIDRLLASPHYGERWARHWLDAARYAETTANDANAVMRYAWRYRDWVIDALNRDLPYDQFIVEQLAGDLLPTDDLAERRRRIVATGFLMIGSKALAETDKEQSRLDIVDDQIDVTGRAFLGLTLACSRCHDHKFDALRTVDYYALAGIFRSTEPFRDEARNATMWWEYPLPDAAGGTDYVVMAPNDDRPRNLRVHVRGNRFTLGQIAPRGFPQIIAPEAPSIDPEQSGRLELARWIASAENPLTARVLVNRVWQHHFGRGLAATSDNFGTRGERPTHPELLDHLASRFVAEGWSLKRLHRAIVLSAVYRQDSRGKAEAVDRDPENALLSHFPRRRLSAEELRDGLLLVSGELDARPGGNESAEALWAVAEILDAERGFAPNRMSAGDPFYTTFRKRSVYLPVVRNMLPDVLALFDAADPNSMTPTRTETTVPSQSLFLLNSPLVRDLSRSFARRLLAPSDATDAERLDAAHRAAFGRAADGEEIAAAEEFLRAYLAAPATQNLGEADRRLAAWQSYCQTLLCANEFLYVE